MLKKLSIIAILASIGNLGLASQKPEQEETAPAVKRAKIDQGTATTSIAAAPAVASDIDKPASSASASAAGNSAKKKTSSTAILDMLRVVPIRTLQNIILGYLDKWEEVETLRNHNDQFFWSVAWSPDGKYVASGSADKTIKIWEAASWTEVKTLTGHGGPVVCIAWSPDSQLLASGSHDKTIKIWNVANWTEVKTLTGHNSPVTSVSWSPNGKQLASGSPDGDLLDSSLWAALSSAGSDDSFYNTIYNSTIKIWDVAIGKKINELVVHNSQAAHFQLVAWSPDGKQLAFGAASAADQKIILWNVTTGEFKMLTGHRGTAKSIAWSPDSKYVASEYGCEITIWDAGTCKQVTKLTGHKDDLVTFVAWSPDGKQMASGAWDGTVKIRDVKTWKEVATVSYGHRKSVSSIAWSPDGNYLAAGGSDSRVKIWKNPAIELAYARDSNQTKAVSSLEISPQKIAPATSEVPAGIAPKPANRASICQRAGTCTIM